ncbi:MAG: hypothetical protein AAF798_18015 [Bacteroidota bacterium]
MQDFTGTEKGLSKSRTHLNEPLTLRENSTPRSRHSQFFNAADLRTLLRNPECMGIRFYPYLTTDGAFKVIGVGVLPDRSELDLSSEDVGFFQSEGASPSKRMNKVLAADLLRPTNEYSAYFSRSTIEQQLDTDNAIGLRIYEDMWERNPMVQPVDGNETLEEMFNASIEQHPTLGITPVGADMRDIRTSEYLISAMPCPPDCGDDPDYTFKASAWRFPTE